MSHLVETMGYVDQRCGDPGGYDDWQPMEKYQQRSGKAMHLRKVASHGARLG